MDGSTFHDRVTITLLLFLASYSARTESLYINLLLFLLTLCHVIFAFRTLFGTHNKPACNILSGNYFLILCGTLFGIRENMQVFSSRNDY